MATGLTLPRPQQVTLNGVMSAKPLSTLLKEEADRAAQAVKASNAASSQPVVQELVSHIKRLWTLAKEAKQPIERDMLAALRSRRGEYDPAKLTQIKQEGGSEIYMMVFATKARQFKALLADVLLASGSDKPWSIYPTPVPELPPAEVNQIMQGVYEVVSQAEMMGMPMTVQEIRQRLVDAKATIENQIVEKARREAEKAELAVEDDLSQGDFLGALDQFLDDLAVFKTAFIKGPVVRMSNELTWVTGPDGQSTPQVGQVKRKMWERVDPLMIYPVPWARSVHDAPMFERHKLSRADLSAMIGIDGYSEDAIRAVLEEHGSGGLSEWLSVDTERASVESGGTVLHDRSDLMDALQFWGSVSGKMLREWGMTDQEAPDEAKEYEVELWLIGTHVIKAVINPDPLLRRPYYADGFSRIPGAFWHNSLYDVIRDHEDMCNAAARALANNMGITSGPQVVVNIDRIPQGEQLTNLYPWKIHQVTNDPMGSSAAPVSFFQPTSNANELMGVFERFSQLADEASGIPKYMAGLSGGEGGAGRTASGMSMMVTAAGKQVRNSLASIDTHVISQVVTRAYQWIMQYEPERELRGDLAIKARGATSLVAKETAQVRLNEFLAATGNPIDMQIIGMGGRAELLRHAVKRLDLNTDKVVPSESVVKMNAAQAQQMAMLQAQQGEGGPQNGQSLMDSSPVVDNFSPKPQ